MASITINIEDSQLQRVIDLFAEAHGYQPFIEEDLTRPAVPNPETKEAFARRVLVERVRRTVLEQEVLNNSQEFRDGQQDPGIS